MSAPVGETNPWEKWGWVFAAIWLIFLLYPVLEVLDTSHPVPVKALGLAVVAAFAVVYVVGFSLWDERPWLAFGLLVALGLVLIPIIGFGAIGVTPYLGGFAALQLPAPWWPRVTAVVALLPLLALASDGEFPEFFFVMAWPIIIAMSLMRVFFDRERRWSQTRDEMALVAERERVARDVHDVLGHSLTALSVKAELAARLIDVDPDRARVELESIQDTARQALAEVRATVGGLRASNLEAEVATAPQVLADAGIETRLVGEPADTDPRHRTLLAWVLREAVTNVVRHSGAREVVIELGARGLTVTDDGTGHRGAEGNGLRGMRERIEAAGGTLALQDAAPGTKLEVTL